MPVQVSFSNQGVELGQYYSKGNSANAQNNRGQDVNSLAKLLNDKTPAFNNDQYNSVQSVQNSNNGSSESSSINKFASRGWHLALAVGQNENLLTQTNSTVTPISQLLNSGLDAGAAMSQSVGSAFDFVQSGSPPTRLNNVSAYNALNARGALAKLEFARPYNSLVVGQALKSNYLSAQATTYDSIYQSLQNLRTTASALQNPDIYNVNRATSSAPGVVTAVADPNAGPKMVKVKVDQLAKPQVLASAVPTATQTKTVTTTTTSYMDTPTATTATASNNGGSLSAGKYYFRVSAVDKSGNESAAVQEISATTTGKNGSVSLSWNPVANAKSYNIYYGTAQGKENAYFTSPNATYKVTKSGNGDHEGKPLETGTPINTTTTSTIKSTVSLAPNDALGYSGKFSVNGFQVNVGANDSLFDLATRINTGSVSPSGVTATAATTGGSGNGESQGNNKNQGAGNLAAGTYYYRVSALDSRGNETAASPVASATVSGSKGSVSLSWDKLSNAEQYRVYFGTTAGSQNSYYSASGRTNSFTDTGATSAAVSGTPALTSSANNGFGFGGSQYTGVSAGVSNGQLLFTSQNGGGIALDDPNGILQGLGVLYKNPLNNSVAVNTLNPQYQAPQSASFSVDDTQYSSAVNGPFQAGGYTLNLAGTGTAGITTTQDAAFAEQSVQNFVNSYNDAMDNLNKVMMSGGAIADNLKMQEIYSDVVKFLNSVPTMDFSGTNSLSDVGVKSADGNPTSIQETVLNQLANKGSSENSSSPALTSYFPAGQGPLSLLTQSGRIGVNSQDNFKMAVDPTALKNALLKNPAGAGEFLNFAASRLQSRLDVHLQPDYGTLAFQRKIVDYYQNNQDQVMSLMGDVQKISSTGIEIGSTKTLLGSLSA